MTHTTTASATRRAFLGAAAGVGGTALLSGTAAGQTDLSGWFSNTGNADGIVDKRGQSSVEIGVGTDGNGAGFGFGPAAVRVDPGTQVTWRWTGKGGRHNVVATGGAFESPYHSESGATFSYTPSSKGVIRYYCVPHESVGMKGALVVGDVAASIGGGGDGATTTAAGDGESAGAAAEETPTESAPARTFDGWLAETDNYSEVVDATDAEVVTVSLGAEGNGGRLAFDPPAVHVSAGTTVVWEWVTDGTAHSVRAADGSFASERADQVGHRYAVTVEGDGVIKYDCGPHGGEGMRGVIVVGRGEQAGLDLNGLAMLGGGLAVLGAAAVQGVRAHNRSATGPGPEPGERA